MSDTKDKILRKSLELFNRYGLSNVSQRKITTALAISPGNLTYHFKKKSDIEEALYFEFVSLIDVELQGIEHEAISLSSVQHTTDRFFTHLYDYRFIFMDIVYLMRNNKKIAKHYEALNAQRKTQFLKIFEGLIARKIFRKEELPDEYLHLYERIQIIFDFYLSHIEISDREINSNEIQNFKILFMQGLYPYFTNQSKKEFLSI